MIIDKIALILTIVGALNWGSIGLFQFDLVAWIFGGTGALLARVVYTLVALAGIWTGIFRRFTKPVYRFVLYPSKHGDSAYWFIWRLLNNGRKSFAGVYDGLRRFFRQSGCNDLLSFCRL